MTVALNPAVDLDAFLAWLNREAGDRTHLYCCNPNRALCGLDLTGGPFVAPADCEDRERLCRVCVHLDDVGASCGAILCRLRRWWRLS